MNILVNLILGLIILSVGFLSGVFVALRFFSQILVIPEHLEDLIDAETSDQIDLEEWK